MQDSIDKAGPDWVAVRHAYETGNEPVEALCRRFGVPSKTLYARREREGWAHRNTRASTHRPALIARLFKLFDRQMRQMENEMTTTGDKEVALLSTMARTLEKLIALDADQRKDRPAGPTRSDRDMAALRERLAMRIEELGGL